MLPYSSPDPVAQCGMVIRSMTKIARTRRSRRAASMRPLKRSTYGHGRGLIRTAHHEQVDGSLPPMVANNRAVFDRLYRPRGRRGSQQAYRRMTGRTIQAAADLVTPTDIASRGHVFPGQPRTACCGAMATPGAVDLWLAGCGQLVDSRSCATTGDGAATDLDVSPRNTSCRSHHPGHHCPSRRPRDFGG